MFSPNVGWLFMSVTTGMYLIYEFMHFCCHVDENWFVRSCPFVNTLRRHHTAHHNARLMMETNMNLTFPIADWLFGTSDLNRGLIGTLLNGYDTQYLKKTCVANRAVPTKRRRPRWDHTRRLREAPRSNDEVAMPSDVKAALSVIFLIVAAVLAYWRGSPILSGLFDLHHGHGAIHGGGHVGFPEAGVKKGDVKKGTSRGLNG